MTDEVFEDAVRYGTGSSVRLDHEHLVRLPGVDIAVGDFRDGGVCTERANGAASTPVAIYVLDEEVVAGILLMFRLINIEIMNL